MPEAHTGSADLIAGNIIHWYQMVVAAGGSIQSQVYIRAFMQDGASRRDDFRDMVVVCDSDTFVPLSEEPLEKWRDHCQLQSNDAPWGHVTDGMLFHELFFAPSARIKSARVILADYDHNHGDYEHLTVTATTIYKTLQPDEQPKVISPTAVDDMSKDEDMCFIAKRLKRGAAPGATHLVT